MAGTTQQPNMLILMYTGALHMPCATNSARQFQSATIQYIRGLLLELLLEIVYKHPKKPANQFLE